ncbi:MAG: hypothetical protein Q8M19_14080 [Reyranella sp.]|nr:hypothetical protein [Reyranella sp.]
MAASADRTTRTRSGELLSLPVKGDVKIFAGTIVALGADGYARPGRATATDIAVGIAAAQADNTGGADGAIRVEVFARIVGCFANSGSGDAITLTEVKKAVFVVDDVTVAKTNGAGARPVAGKVIDVDASGVWIEFGGPAVDAIVAGVAAGYKIARGVAAVTGTETVATGLSHVVAAFASPQDDPDGVALAGASATVGDQAGAPAAGSIIVKAWKVTAVDNATLIAATAPKNINWVAVGT